MRSRTLLSALALVALLAAGAAAESGGERVEAQSTVPGEVLLRFHPEPSGLDLRIVTSRLALFASAEEVRYNRKLDLWTLRFEGQTAGEVIEGLESDAGVAIAQPNYIYRHAVDPNDELYSSRQRPYLAAINAPAAWEIEAGDPSVVVAVIDGGVDIDHPELNGRIWTNSGDPVDGTDNDDNGCTDDYHGCSFQSPIPDGNVADLDGHGTFVAGIIAAKRDNGIGVAGLSNATIMPVRALDATGDGATEQFIEAIKYAAENGADIINMSLALDPADPACPRDEVVEAALREAYEDYGATMVAAAGNYANACVSFPASSSHVIGVSASGPPERPDIRAFFSHYGPEVDVTAPGMGIISTCPIPTAVPTHYCPGTAYGSGDGTSFSTPIVSGIAALLLAQNPSLSNDAIKARLEETAYPLPDDQHGNWDGAGRVDAARALGADAVYVHADLAILEPAEVDVSLAVMGVGGVECQAHVWDEPIDAPEILELVFHRPSISGTFGVSECAEFWPPSAVRPWRLLVDNRGEKAATVNAWSLSLGGESCAGAIRPVAIPAKKQRWNDIGCEVSAGNDSRDHATEVDITQLPLRFEQDVRNFTNADDPVPACLGGASFSRTAWFRLEGAASNGNNGVVADAFGSEMDAHPGNQNVKTVIAVYRETPAGLEEVGCDIRFAAAGRIESRVTWRPDGLSTYYVMAAAFQSVPMGVLRVNFSPALLAENDTLAGAATITTADAYPVTQAAHLSTYDQLDPDASCLGRYVNSVWFRVSEDAGNQTAFTTAGSDYNTGAAVLRREGNGALTEVACNNNEAPGTLTSRATWLSDGGEYFVVVGSFPDIGVGVLRARLEAP